MKDQITATLNDLQVKSMLFDMDIDIEALRLIEKNKHPKAPMWLIRWKDKVEQSDFDVQFDVDQE